MFNLRIANSFNKCSNLAFCCSALSSSLAFVALPKNAFALISLITFSCSSNALFVFNSFSSRINCFLANFSCSF